MPERDEQLLRGSVDVAIDPDVLDAFVQSTVRRDRRSGRVAFECAGHDVTVLGNGRVTVSEDTEPDGSRRIDDR